MTETVSPDHPNLVAISRRGITRRLRDLRYSASVGAPLPVVDDDQTEVEFLQAVSAWLDEYGQRLIVAVDTTSDMAAELKTLRDQRAAVRSFFGTT